MKKIIFFLLVYGIPGALHSQVLPLQRYTSRDGLIADRITAITQDEQGMMWFGSYFGLGNYDGIRFQKMPLPFEQQNKYVTCLLPLNKKIYAGFLFGGGLAELSNGKATAYSLLKINPRTSNDISALGKFNDSSIVLSNGNNEIYRFQNGKFTLLYSLMDRLMPHSIFHLEIDKHQNLWVGTNSGLFVFSTNDNKRLSFFQNQEVVSMVQSGDGKIWLCVRDGVQGSVFHCDGINENKELNISREGVIPNIRSARFKGNLQQGFWALDAQKGLLNVTNANQVIRFPIPLDLGADIKIVYADRENNLWIANDPGLTKVTNYSSVSWTFDEYAAAGGFIAKDTNGVVWVNNAKELYRIQGDSMEKVKFKGKEGGLIGKMLFDSEQNLWAVRWNEGIWKTRWNSGRLIERKYIKSFGKEKIIGGALEPGPDGTIWFSGGNGIFYLKNGEVKQQFNPKNKNGNNLFINVIATDPRQKVLWLGDNASGIFKVRYTSDNGDQYKIHIEKSFGVAEGLTDPYVRSMLMDHKGYLWIGTRSGGVYRLNTLSKKEEIESISPKPSLLCSRITAIAEERHDAIWFASCDGIYRLDYHTGAWQYLNVSDGILSAEVFHLAITEKDKKVWVMTEEGITRIDYSALATRTIPPLVHLTEVNVLGKPDTLALIAAGVRKYQYGYNSVGFVFAGSSFYNEKKNVYRYMLEGFDQNWSEPVSTNAVNYASLAPGTYTFKVQAANAKGVLSESPATFSFQIILPFYRRPWFIFSCIALVALLFYLIRVDRLEHQYKVEKIRLRIARDLHDDIGSALGSINLMSQTAQRRLEKEQGTTEVASAFSKIGQSAQTTLESMDDIIWSINPDKDRLGDLVIRMREFAIPLLEAKEIAFDFKMNAADYRKLPMNLRKNIFLIFKEAIFNIVKHADCTRVLVLTEIRNNMFQLQVKDNGKGFDTNKPSQRNGLRNMEKRAELVGGEIKIDSTKDIGTTLNFRCVIK